MANDTSSAFVGIRGCTDTRNLTPSNKLARMQALEHASMHVCTGQNALLRAHTWRIARMQHIITRALPGLSHARHHLKHASPKARAHATTVAYYSHSWTNMCGKRYARSELHDTAYCHGTVSDPSGIDSFCNYILRVVSSFNRLLFIAFHPTQH
jgi:hypothetical protein